MATNEFEAEPAPTRAQQLASIFGTTKAAVTGSVTIPLRIVVLFVAAALSCLWGTQAGQMIAVGALLMLALSWPRK